MKEEGREGERRVKGREGRVGEVEEHVKGSRGEKCEGGHSE